MPEVVFTSNTSWVPSDDGVPAMTNVTFQSISASGVAEEAGAGGGEFRQSPLLIEDPDETYEIVIGGPGEPTYAQTPAMTDIVRSISGGNASGTTPGTGGTGGTGEIGHPGGDGHASGGGGGAGGDTEDGNDASGATGGASVNQFGVAGRGGGGDAGTGSFGGNGSNYGGGAGGDPGFPAQGGVGGAGAIRVSWTLGDVLVPADGLSAWWMFFQ